jgi:hypothetical protein
MRLLLLLACLVLTCSSVAHAELPPGSPHHRALLRRTSALEAGFGFGLITRRFSYHQDVYGFLRDYELPVGPEIALDVRVYPGAFVRPGIPGAFGLELIFERSFGIESERGNGVRFPTIQRILEANAIARLARGGHELALVFGYGHHAFELGRSAPSEPDLDNIPDVPSAGYGYLRIGTEGRAVLHDRLALVLGAAYLVVLDTGGIEDPLWFPRATAGGMTVSARVVLAVVRNVDVRLGFSYRRYFLDMHSEPGDRNIAGGALDRFTSTELSAAYRF